MSTERSTNNSDGEKTSDFKNGASHDKIIYKAFKNTKKLTSKMRYNVTNYNNTLQIHTNHKLRKFDIENWKSAAGVLG